MRRDIYGCEILSGTRRDPYKYSNGRPLLVAVSPKENSIPRKGKGVPLAWLANSPARYYS